MAIPIGSRSVLARWMAIPGVLAVVWSWAGGALAEEPVPSLETLLSAGVENHPTVVAAKAKVALAEAELNSARFEVSRQVVALRGDYDAQVQDLARAQTRLQAASQHLDTVKSLVATGSVHEQALANAQFREGEARSALIDAKAKMTGLAMELQRLLKTATVHSAAVPTEQPGAPVRPLPGPVVRKMAAALGTNIPGVDFSEVPLKDVVRHLEEVAKVPITLDTSGGVSSDNPVSLRLKEVTLSAALQAIEDTCLDTVFVVREYGLLGTPREKAREEGYVRIRDLRNLDPGTAAPKAASDVRPQAKDPPKP